MKWIRKPITRPINPIDVWEHTPLDIYRYGEYPRFLRPPGPRAGDFDTEWVRTTETASARQGEING